MQSEEEPETDQLYDVNLLSEENDYTHQSQTNGINADEFEHIAEIYDHIRMLH